MTVKLATRRRFLSLIAGGAAAFRSTAALSETPLTRWTGRVLGADASLTIRDPDRARAAHALADCAGEIERIERALSLYRPDSALVQLNGSGELWHPPGELVDVMTFASQISLASDGAFDVTVQPLWDVHVRAHRDMNGFTDALVAARARVNWRRLQIAKDRIVFTAPQMAATLNGIAQGYAADRIAERLRSQGFPNVLADLGEFRALGERALGQPWHIGVARPGNRGLAASLSLSNNAVATSSPSGTRFDADGTRHHLFDPRSGRSAQGWASVSVVADTAMRADALSTAIAVAPKAAAETILNAGKGQEAVLIDGGRVVRIRA
ncbi:MAG: FAD:protein FMN transferase [Hyphomicrobiales bacterium]|nr:FAD:protein FMN transferase [Hyphomicrobiales bacterium]